MKISDAVLVLDHHLAIQHGGVAGQLATSLDNPAIGARPVIAVAGEGADLAAVNDHQGAIAIMLDFVNPVLSGGWFRRDWGFPA